MRSLVPPLLLVLVAACSDAGGLTAPEELPAPAAPAAPADRPDLADADPIQDAIDRLAPAVGGDGATASLRGQLQALLAGHASADAAAVEVALQQLEANDPAVTADADAIRLALMAPR
jgi:hypothetical protein